MHDGRHWEASDDKRVHQNGEAESEAEFLQGAVEVKDKGTEGDGRWRQERWHGRRRSWSRWHPAWAVSCLGDGEQLRVSNSREIALVAFFSPAVWRSPRRVPANSGDHLVSPAWELAIAAELAQAHSGTFTAASQPGHGTRLTLTVPRASTSPPWRRHIACTACGFA